MAAPISVATFLAAALLLSLGETTIPPSVRVTCTVQPLPIPQVDYEPLLRPGAHGMPTLNLSLVNYSRTVVKTHQAVVMESEFVKVVLLPAMGRLYRMVYKPTGHDVLWRNDIAWPGGANNALGWWLWIGGVEYTLPGEEHGYTWALEWAWRVEPPAAGDGGGRSVAATVVEPTTGLRETLRWTLAPGSAALQTHVLIENPGASVETFAHWVNVPFVPGGTNELTDNTELLIPTEAINISSRWQADLGSSPQAWPASPLRFLKGWSKGMGDIMAQPLLEGYHGVYSHDLHEGAVRIVDKNVNPEVDTWTYGFHPPKGTVPMGSGAASTGYAEMWGGNARCNTLGPLYCNVREPLAPNTTLQWTESLYAFHGIGGLSVATEQLAVRGAVGNKGAVDVSLCAARELDGLSVRLLEANKPLTTRNISGTIRPGVVERCALSTSGAATASSMEVVVLSGTGEELARFVPATAASFTTHHRAEAQ